MATAWEDIVLQMAGGSYQQGNSAHQEVVTIRRMGITAVTSVPWR